MRKALIYGTAAAALLASLTACSDDADTGTTGSVSTTGDALQVDANGVSPVASSDLADQLDEITVGSLTTAERESLIFMRQEEKLAEDVYRALYAKWNLPIFSNIASAEATHTASVKTLLDRYSIADPVMDRAAGDFENAQIDALYDKLVAQGNVSEIEALKVGATIEDLDIVDLQKRATTTPDIDLVYDNLEKGSRNHLRSFTTQLSTRGATYTPIYLTVAAYEAIVGSGIERGGAARSGS
ncbi:MAG: DUF2202 domain-containing protein [Acidimicrobiia bacterium]